MSVAIAKWTLDDDHRRIETGRLDGRPVELLNGDMVDTQPCFLVD